MSGKFFKEGFTLIELSLSIAFIAILSLSIVLIILNTIASYRRGMTLNNINTTGMALVDDMKSAVQNSSSRSIARDCDTLYGSGTNATNCKKSGGENFVTLKKYAYVNLAGKRIYVPVYGAFCSGDYSYIWNSGYYFADNAIVENVTAATIKYNANTPSGIDTKTNFRLLKVRDDARSVCMSVFRNNYGLDVQSSFGGDFDISGSGYITLVEEPEELLSSDGNSDLVLYDLSAAAPIENATHDDLFYAVSFILGTTRGGADITAGGKSCAAPDDFATEAFDYCAINKFNFAVQASGE